MENLSNRDLANPTLESQTSKPLGSEYLELLASEGSITRSAEELLGFAPESYVNWYWQMKHQVQTYTDAIRYSPKLQNLSESERLGFEKMNPSFQAGITPYYMSLMGQTDDCPVRLQALPRVEEMTDALGVKDPLCESDHSTVKEVVQVYPDRVAFCVAQLCPVYCRYCFRKRRDEEDGLHFNRTIVDRGVQYIASNPAIRDVLITGGDPFVAHDHVIEDVLKKIRAIPHVEIVRFGTRTPVTLPYRITKNLVEMLAKYHPVFVNTHFNCVEEITPESKRAIELLVNAGIPVGNQSVLLKGVNDSYEQMLALLRGLLKMRVRPYYLFHPHAVAGTEHLRPSIQVGMDIMKKLRGNITGLGIPSYIVDTPSGKVPILPQYILAEDGSDLVLQTPRGEIWRERGVIV